MGDGFSVTLGDIDVTDVDEAGVSWRCTQLDGWAGSPASTLSPVQKTRGPGAWLSPRQLTPRVITAGGFAEGPDRPTLRDALDRLNAAVALDGFPVEVGEDELVRRITGYRQDDVLTSWLSSTLAQWSAQFVAVDPRKFGDELTASTGPPSSVGGLSIPFTIPFAISATVVTGRCILTNPGNTTGPVRLRIEGTDPDHPLVAPRVTHTASGLALVFSSSLVLGAGDWIDVDMERQTVLANGTSSRNGLVTSRGWSGFDPGPNVWSCAAESGTGLFTVFATPAWQ